MKEPIYYIKKAESIAKQYPTNGSVIAYLRVLDEEGEESEETLEAAKGLVELKG